MPHNQNTRRYKWIIRGKSGSVSFSRLKLPWEGKKECSQWKEQKSRIQSRTVKVIRALRTEMKRLSEMKSGWSGLKRRCLQGTCNNSLQIHEQVLQRRQKQCVPCGHGDCNRTEQAHSSHQHRRAWLKITKILAKAKTRALQ